MSSVISLADIAAERGIKYFLISFVDLLGVQRAKLVPASAIAGMSRNGAGFAGFAAWFDMTPADPDMIAMPDPDSLIQLPWKPEVGWLASDLFMRGEEVAPGAAQPAEAAAEHGCGVGLRDEVRRRSRVLSHHDGRAADLRPRRSRGKAMLRRFGADASLRRHHRDL